MSDTRVQIFDFLDVINILLLLSCIAFRSCRGFPFQEDVSSLTRSGNVILCKGSRYTDFLFTINRIASSVFILTVFNEGHAHCSSCAFNFSLLRWTQYADTSLVCDKPFLAERWTDIKPYQLLMSVIEHWQGFMVKCYTGAPRPILFCKNLSFSKHLKICYKVSS